MASGWARAYVAAIARWRVAVLLLAAGAVATGASYGISLFSHTGSSGTPPPGCASEVAGAAMAAAFPRSVGSASVTVVLSAGAPGGVVSGEYAAFMLALNASAGGFDDGGASRVRLDFASYVTTPPLLPALARSFVDASNSTTFATVTVRPSREGTGKRLLAFLEGAIAAARGAHAVRAVDCTGGAAFSRDTDAGLLGDLARMDSIAFPLAFAVLALVLRSARFLLVPLVTVAVSASASFSIMVWSAAASDSLTEAEQTTLRAGARRRVRPLRRELRAERHGKRDHRHVLRLLPLSALAVPRGDARAARARAGCARHGRATGR